MPAYASGRAARDKHESESWTARLPRARQAHSAAVNPQNNHCWPYPVSLAVFIHHHGAALFQHTACRKCFQRRVERAVHRWAVHALLNVVALHPKSWPRDVPRHCVGHDPNREACGGDSWMAGGWAACRRQGRQAAQQMVAAPCSTRQASRVCAEWSPAICSTPVSRATTGGMRVQLLLSSWQPCGSRPLSQPRCTGRGGWRGCARPAAGNQAANGASCRRPVLAVVRT